jgi:uncharacterized coiled-coil DUF342 family protein
MCIYPFHDTITYKLQTLQGEIEQNSHRLEYIEKGGEYLLQKCESRDAVQIQKDIDEFRQVVDEVVTRLNKCQKRLQKTSSGEVRNINSYMMKGFTFQD